ncbi:MAG TPA: hemolysin family protein, partial [Planctomycetota bacterium]|nr:hemolysin family protein [Planctomycetota bacterium]
PLPLSTKHSGHFALPVLRVLRILLLPVTAPLMLVTKFIIRNVLGIREELELEQERQQLADEIRAAVEDSDDSEALDDEEKAWIENIVEFRKEDAAGIMTPRTDMICVEASSTLQAAMQLGVESGHSRLPVFEEKLDSIIGVFYLRDAVAALAAGSPTVMQDPVRQYMRDAYFVPESKRVSNLLREFREMRVQIAIVVDEYGGTSGLASIEDILEEIVGEIEDEYDDPRVTDEPFVVKDEGHWAECDAKIRIGDLNESLVVELPESEDYETLGGFVASQLGRIGTAGEVFHWQNVEFTILSADARRLGRVRLRVLETEARPS